MVGVSDDDAVGAEESATVVSEGVDDDSAVGSDDVGSSVSATDGDDVGSSVTTSERVVVGSSVSASDGDDVGSSVTASEGDVVVFDDVGCAEGVVVVVVVVVEDGEVERCSVDPSVVRSDGGAEGRFDDGVVDESSVEASV